jgi:hypothetical protein
MYSRLSSSTQSTLRRLLELTKRENSCFAYGRPRTRTQVRLVLNLMTFTPTHTQDHHLLFDSLNVRELLQEPRNHFNHARNLHRSLNAPYAICPAPSFTCTSVAATPAQKTEKKRPSVKRGNGAPKASVDQTLQSALPPHISREGAALQTFHFRSHCREMAC